MTPATILTYSEYEEQKKADENDSTLKDVRPYDGFHTSASRVDKAYQTDGQNAGPKRDTCH